MATLLEYEAIYNNAPRFDLQKTVKKIFACAICFNAMDTFDHS